VAERQSARGFIITNDGLTQSGTGCFIAVHIWQQWASMRYVPCRVQGLLNDRRTMLGELNWIFTAITDTIAWNVLSRGLFTWQCDCLRGLCSRSSAADNYTVSVIKVIYDGTVSVWSNCRTPIHNNIDLIHTVPQSGLDWFVLVYTFLCHHVGFYVFGCSYVHFCQYQPGNWSRRMSVLHQSRD